MKYKKPDQDFDDYAERSFLWEEGSEDHECEKCGKHFMGDISRNFCRKCEERSFVILNYPEELYGRFL